jgi:HEAT repeat protein
MRKGGPSVNPGGRPKVIAHVRDLARKHTPAAIQALADNLTDENGHVRNAAAMALLDRAWGRPEQAHLIAAEIHQTIETIHAGMSAAQSQDAYMRMLEGIIVSQDTHADDDAE